MVGAAAHRPVAKQRKTIAPARTASRAPRSTLGQARPSIGTSEGKGPGPLARPGANGANIAKPYKGPECGNGYRQRGRCDSRPDWHKLTVLISSAGHHDPHHGGGVITISSARAGLITFRIGRAGDRDTYHHRVTVPDWHKYACTIVRLYYYAAMSICGYAHKSILRMILVISFNSTFVLLCGKTHNHIDTTPAFSDTATASPYTHPACPDTPSAFSDTTTANPYTSSALLV